MPPVPNTPWHDLATEIKNLRKMFDNIETFNNLKMKLDYEHIFEWLIKDGDIKGFHHDWLGALEKQGKYLANVLRTTAEGFYEAEIIINGIKKTKTFFPKDMTRAEVCELVMNIVKHSKHKAKLNKGVWTINQKISKDVTLCIVIKKSGFIKTVYPKIKRKK